MSELTLDILGTPHPQMRPRAARIPGQVHARVYKAGKQREAEESFVAQVINQLPPGHKPLAGPLEVVINFYVVRPQSHFGTGRNAGVLKPSAPDYPTTKPDFDNAIKHVCDCFNSLVWVDDRLVVRSRVDKDYDEKPHTVIRIRKLANGEKGQKGA